MSWFTSPAWRTCASACWTWPCTIWRLAVEASMFFCEVAVRLVLGKIPPVGGADGRGEHRARERDQRPARMMVRFVRILAAALRRLGARLGARCGRVRRTLRGLGRGLRGPVRIANIVQ